VFRHFTCSHRVHVVYNFSSLFHVGTPNIVVEGLATLLRISAWGPTIVVFPSPSKCMLVYYRKVCREQFLPPSSFRICHSHIHNTIRPYVTYSVGNSSLNYINIMWPQNTISYITPRQIPCYCDTVSLCSYWYSYFCLFVYLFVLWIAVNRKRNLFPTFSARVINNKALQTSNILR